MLLICLLLVHATRAARAVLAEYTEPPSPSCVLLCGGQDPWLSRNKGCYQSIEGYIRTRTLFYNLC